jgi:hypothetical protein
MEIDERFSRRELRPAMLSLFKRHLDPKTLTFKQRADAFWAWFATEAPRFAEEIDARRGAALHPVVSAKVEEFFPGFAWSFGPGEGEATHSFTLSGEGNPHRQFLAAFWQSAAPKIAGWVFYGAKQPVRDISHLRLEIGERSFDPLAFWLVPRLDEAHERVNLRVFHPAFAELDERMRWTVIFLYLDEVLGEIGTQNWIGEIEPGDEHLADAMPLRELPSFIESAAAERGWKKGGPGETWTSFHLEDPTGGVLRRDIIAGTTCQIVLIAESESGHLEADPLEGTGAEYVYVAFPASHLPVGNEVAARAEIEEALDSALTSAAAGRVLGGALGLDHAYIDILIFDGRRSLEIIEGTLKPRALPAGTTLERFAKAHAAERQEL